MATRGAIAEMEQDARRRIDAACTALAKRHGVDEPVVPFERKTDMVMLRHLQTQADFLESLVKDADARTPEIAADADDVTLGAEVTKDGTPVVVTEAIDGDKKPTAKKGKA